MSFFQKLIRKIADIFGYHAIFLQKKFWPTFKQGYSVIVPCATYSPWLLDDEFMALNKIITQNNNTLVDIYRCHELWELVAQVKHLEGAIVEVGVWRGGTGALIGKKATIEGISDTVYLCDTFEGVVKTSDKDSLYNGGEHADTTQSIVEKLVYQEVGLNNVQILKGIFPEDSEHLIKEDKIRFCHIDVDVYSSAKDVFEWVWKRMPVGGIVVFDDYGFVWTDGVTKFVDEEKKKTDRVVLYNLNAHAIIIKTA